MEDLQGVPNSAIHVEAGAAFRDERLRGRPWLWPTLLSLDAPLVAVLWQRLFVATVRAQVAPAVTAIMALVVWLIYVADRILDSFLADEDAQQPVRHRFYRAYRMAFLPPFFAVLMFTCWLASTRLDSRTLRAGIWLTFAVAAYFAVVHSFGTKAQRWFPKELVVAILFFAGTTLPVATRIHDFQVSYVLPIFLFILVLWMNASLIEYSEWMRLRDGDSGRPHESTVVAGRHFALVGSLAGLLALSASAGSTFEVVRSLLLAEGACALALTAIGLRWRSIPSYAVRLAADASLLTPGVFLILFRK